MANSATPPNGRLRAWSQEFNYQRFSLIAPMTKFDIQQLRQQLQGDHGYRFSLGLDIEDAKRTNSLGSNAHHLVGDAVKCYLVDFVEPGHALLNKAIAYFDAAIERNEQRRDYDLGWCESQRTYERTLARWMLFGEHDSEELLAANATKRQYYEWQKKLDTFDVTRACPEYLDARCYAELLELIQQTFAGKKSVPFEVQVARQIAENGGVTHPIDADCQKMLKRNVNTWYTRGHWTYAATWVKVLCWNPAEGDTPISAFQKSLLYLPRD